MELWLGLDPTLPYLALEEFHQIEGCGNTKIGLDQQLLDLLEIGRTQPPHQRTNVGQGETLEPTPDPELLAAKTCHDHQL